MKILLLEFSPERGHKQLFENICNLLARNSSVTVMLPEGQTYSCKNVEVMKLPYSFQISKLKLRLYRSLATIIRSLKIMYCAAKVDRKNQYDCIVCVTYNEVAFGLGRIFFKNPDKVFLMHHNNLDSVSNNEVKRKIFSSYVGKVKHIVQCRFISEYFKKQYDVAEGRLIVWPHPLNCIEKSDFKGNVEYELDCVGISNSNDEHIIDEIIQLEDKMQLIKKNKMHIVLKSREKQFDNGYLKVISGFLPKEEYDDYIARGKCIFLPFPLDFKNRMSGTVIDAFSNHKPVIATKFELIKSCAEIYPQITKYYSAESFVDDIRALSMMSTEDERRNEFERFMEKHSSDYLSEIMYKQLVAALNNEGCDIETDF